MFGVLILILIGLGFYAFIAFAPEEAIQLVLVAFWGLMLLSAIISPFIN